MTDEGEPRRAVSRFWAIVLGDDTSHDIFVDVDSKSPCNLLCNTETSEPGIPAFYLQNQLDEIGAWSLGTGFASSFGGVEQPVFSFIESLMESQNG